MKTGLKTALKSTLMLMCVGVLALPGSALARAENPADAPVPDKRLEVRLTRNAIVETRKGDTLAGLARILYGHSTWWARVRGSNPVLAPYGPNETLPVGSRILYLAPPVGDEYVVQTGDKLIRIAIWKSGQLDGWETLHGGSIRPGDRLRFERDGRVKDLSTSQVVLRRAGSPREPEAAAAAVKAVEAPKPVPVVAVKPVVADRARAPAAAAPVKGVAKAPPAPKKGPEFFEEARVLESLAAADRRPAAWIQRYAAGPLWFSIAGLLLGFACLMALRYFPR